jgi:hypothetical protein
MASTPPFLKNTIKGAAQLRLGSPKTIKDAGYE